ncbi:DNA repair protein crb2 [Colletotrichum orbiculare MAFF 240422]|uniref:DNA repair protein crb2 n=1 Tax=Colletotrichum orbiculare (strain 104-T / ATCC 96160 / CBS 514.97 / LARS 414 / MAFF 240422) TaxID=1213857 RepID=A0A484FP58_COLOR|nr:DNA repair protein crb2 [Colletotrichum orbiculare MAFF 240422]
MGHSKSLAAAERKALEGRNETQDSQMLMEYYKAQHGIGVTSSSPPRPSSTSSRYTRRGTKRRRDTSPSEHSDSTSHDTTGAVHTSPPSTATPPATAGRKDTLPQQDSILKDPSATLPAAVADSQDRAANFPTTTNPSTAIGTPSAALSADAPGNLNVDGDAVDSRPEPAPAPGSRVLAPLAQPPRPHADPRKKVKMDISQQSPTQENDGRDYENEKHYERPSFVETSPISQDHATPNQTIPDDDSGAVHFGSLSHLIETDTPVDDEPSSLPDDAAPAMVRGAWRRSSSQQHSSLQRTNVESPLPPTAPLPQTPAQGQNPFAGMKKLGDAALAGSQLFGQTQSSSAVKRFSPTSSRPSPPGYTHNSISPNVVEASPLKNRFNMTSPDLMSSSPQAIRIDLPAPTARERSPSDSGPPEDGTVPESPHHAPSRRSVSLPLATHETRAQSLERRRLASAEAQASDSSEDSDEFGDAIRRKRLVAAKKAQADRELAQLSMTGPDLRSSVEVPQTVKKPRMTRTTVGRFRSRRLQKDPTASEEEFTVADSQGHDVTRPSLVSRDMGDAGAVGKHALVSSNEAIPDSNGATQKSASNGVIPATESSESSSRPKDLIPETSPSNTQSRNAAAATEPSNEPETATTNTVADPAPDAAEDDTKEAEAASQLIPETPQPSVPQPSRRSSRKSRPTTKAHSAKCDAPSAVPETADKDPTAAAGVTSDVPKPVATTAESDIPAGNVTGPDVPVEDETPLPSSPPIPKTRGRAKLAVQRQEPIIKPTTPDARAASTTVEPPGSTSTLSVLTHTPAPSEKAYAASQESVELPPLSADRPTRGRQLAKASARTYGSRVSKTSARRQVRRSTRLDSASTDELTRSPSVSGFENSIIQPPKTTTRGSRLSIMSHTSSGIKILAGMAFAVSFQSKKSGEKAEQYSHRLEQMRSLERSIVQAGGHVLSNGFEELFAPNALKSRSTSPASDKAEDTPPLTLTPWAETLGFTALIADGHSRKVKYMQALALGLPCISDCWVTTCVAKGVVVDWLPYLLCAGQSTVLRDAISSRHLTPYSATDAQLSKVVGQRPKMLDNSKILLVMKKSRAEDRKMPYVFLAHVLGATLCRAHSLDEAREMLSHREAQDDAFDWVYVDEDTGTEADLFGPAGPRTRASKTSKKRKRAAAAAKDDAGPPLKKIRTLSNELVIQSLILGRILEEDELAA